MASKLNKKKGRKLSSSKHAIDKITGPVLERHTTSMEVPPVGHRLIGMSKGATVNLGDYESARIDCWMSTQVLEGEAKEGILELSKEIDCMLEEETEKLVKLIKGE